MVAMAMVVSRQRRSLLPPPARAVAAETVWRAECPDGTYRFRSGSVPYEVGGEDWRGRRWRERRGGRGRRAAAAAPERAPPRRVRHRRRDRHRHLHPDRRGGTEHRGPVGGHLL